MSSWTIRHPTHGHMSLRPTISILGRSVEENSPKHKPLNRTTGDPIFTFAYNSEQQLRRLYVMAYVPAGFWGRLITRIIGDQNVSVALEGLFSAESARESSHMKLAADGRLKAEWLVWQTGIEVTHYYYYYCKIYTGSDAGERTLTVCFEAIPPAGRS